MPTWILQYSQPFGQLGLRPEVQPTLRVPLRGLLRQKHDETYDVTIWREIQTNVSSLDLAVLAGAANEVEDGKVVSVRHKTTTQPSLNFSRLSDT